MSYSHSPKFTRVRDFEVEMEQFLNIAILQDLQSGRLSSTVANATDEDMGGGSDTGLIHTHFQVLHSSEFSGLSSSLA